ncbi:MAG: acyl-CoA synthetase [Proteobacteria bacterium]|nr:acyl-CoA synthetase [Pseudomonadota bacterium]MBU2228479.1 acyl-CoA synthetase [Pseudomonadota bacterium]MBU2261388.1 acyl-CoA synthetase [Pseudomonadota bacterium]
MSMLDYRTYEEAKEKFTIDQIWELFDGTPEHFNLGHECVDRHRDKGIGVRIQFDDGRREEHAFADLSRLTAQFAHVLETFGIGRGDRVAVMLDPSLDFYVCLYGILKRGAIFVPCFTAFGPEALGYRMKDSAAKLLFTTPELAATIVAEGRYRVVPTEAEFRHLMAAQKDTYTVADTAAKDVAVFQYTSGATRKFPQAIPHHHKSVPLLMPAAVFGRGYRFGDRFFCPSSPAWGHGLWHGTLSPMALGVAVGSYSGKFNVRTLLEGLEKFEIDNFGAAPTVYRMIKNSGLIDNYKLKIRKMHYTGEPMDTDTFDFFKAKFGVPPNSGYGSTEVGAVIYQYAGFPNWVAKSGSLGKPMPGLEVKLIDKEGNEVPQGQIGEIAIHRRGKWLRARDAAVIDEDGYFWHKGRVDDIIISAGWTISPTEVEDCLKRHPAVQEAAVIGALDSERGQIVKAFVVANQLATKELAKDIKEFVRINLSKHEYPRVIEFVPDLPKTDGGKVSKKGLK